jgi:hypothetical protein
MQRESRQVIREYDEDELSEQRDLVEAKIRLWSFEELDVAAV